MSYAKSEEKILAEALDQAPSRLAALEEQLPSLQAWDARSSFGQELVYLERLVPSLSLQRQRPAVRATIKDLAKRIADLRSKVDRLPLQTETSSDPVPTGSGTAGKSTSSFAAFLRPGASSSSSASVQHSTNFTDEDAVQLMAAEGQLAYEISKHPVLSMPGMETTVVMREWSAEDDERCEQRTRAILLTLEQQADNVRQIQLLVGEEVAAPQHLIDQVEENVAAAEADTREALVVLSGAADQKASNLLMLVALSILGVGVVSVGSGIGAGACVLCVGERVAFTGAALAATFGTDKALKWKQSVLEWMTAHLPKVFSTLHKDDVTMLRAAGAEVERRLIAKLNDKKSWSAWYLSASGLVHWSVPYRRKSDLRSGGYACSTSWNVDLQASEVFSTIQRLSLTGSLDPGCEVVWSRPVDGVPGTFIRYLIFCSSWNRRICRDFYCVCRSSRIDESTYRERIGSCDSIASAAETWQETEQERYVYAVATLLPDLLERSGLPPSNAGIEHGAIHECGILVTATGPGACHIEVMADVDSGVYGGGMFTDAQVQWHVLRTATNLHNELKGSERSS